jgi:hypothetical protein
MRYIVWKWREVAMQNEGVITKDSRTLVKSEIMRQIHRSGGTTPDLLEQAVFRALTGARREDVDWDIEDNQAGYFLWIKSFDQLIEELIEDGNICVRKDSESGNRTLLPGEEEPDLTVSQLAFGPKHEA